MAYKSIAADLKLIRNSIQDDTENPYAAATSQGYGSSTKYVFALGVKDPAGASPTDAEFYDKDHRSSLPLIVTVSHINNPPGSDLSGDLQVFGVLIRCFVSADTEWTFKSASHGDEEMALEKLNEIAYEFINDSTIIAAFAAAKLTLDKTGIGNIRPVTTAGEQSRQDFGYAMECTFLRENA
jgi:hypothetical protein